MFLPVWAAAYPAVGFPAHDALPGLRSDDAGRVAGRGPRSPGRSPSTISWPKAHGWVCANWRWRPSRAGGRGRR